MKKKTIRKSTLQKDFYMNIKIDVLIVQGVIK